LAPSLPSASASPAPEGGLPGGTPPPNPSVAFNISNEETIRRLRAKGQPVRLFGESDKDRRLRLRALELIEEKGHERVGGQNDFRKALEDVESAERLMRDRNANSTAGDEDKGKKKDDSASGESEIAVLDMALIKTDPDKLYPVIYYALKRVLKEWGESLAERPGKCLTHSVYPSPSLTRPSEHVKRTRQGMLAAATQVQSAEYLKPLFKLLRSRVCPPHLGILFSLPCSDGGNYSPSRMTCCLVWQRSCIICKNVSTSERTMRISVCRSAMHLGQLELPWLGRSILPWRGFKCLDNADP
jgi:pre-mRNA-splicing factor 18